ncbi:MAG: hypothetical protein FP820_10390 [Sulfurimonas sp.]|jgi:hypothetical protein|nr:hypothetical protein [Sulfurimonas sp.]MBU4025578.1 hypothetical protein [bacterium]MBU4059074.1 hypothetical protein [bacterium]
MRLFNGYIKQIKKKIYTFLGFNLLKQEAMLRLALKEEGLDYKDFDIEIDHINGINYINGIELPIIYPKSFFNKAKKMHTVKKILTYYFNGNMSDGGGRKEMLLKFSTPNSKLIESDYGRSKFTKNKFNNVYYSELATAKFGLCPHQKDFKGNQETMWTYRFIECCMVLTIPVVFKETPLGSKFTNGFYYIDDDEALENKNLYDTEKALKNFELSLEKFTLSHNLIQKLKQDLK